MGNAHNSFQLHSCSMGLLENKFTTLSSGRTRVGWGALGPYQPDYPFPCGCSSAPKLGSLPIVGLKIAALVAMNKLVCLLRRLPRTRNGAGRCLSSRWRMNQLPEIHRLSRRSQTWWIELCVKATFYQQSTLISTQSSSGGNSSSM